MVKVWISMIAMLCGAAHGAEPPREISGEFQMPIGAEGLETALQRTLTHLRSSCDVVPETSAYLERLSVGPIRSAVEDGLLLEYRCVPIDDARLKEAGRDVRRPDAGKGIVEIPPPVQVFGPFGWDMTYRNAFDAVAAPRNDTMRKLFRDSWLKATYARSQPDPALFEALQGADTAVLIDYQLRVPVYGGRKLLVFAASSATALLRSIGRRGMETRSVDANAVRDFARAMLTYEQSTPASPPRPFNPPELPPATFVDSGYLGVVSVSVDGQVRQFAITEKDMSADDQRVSGRDSRSVARAAEQVFRTAQ